ncbi:unnamed protein product [Brassica oleracea]
MNLSLLHASSGLEKTRHQINTQTYSNESAPLFLSAETTLRSHRIDIPFFFFLNFITSSMV